MPRCAAFLGLTIGMLLLSVPGASGAAQCSKISYQTGKSELARYLSSQNYSKAQIQFLIGNADRQTRALQANRLNEQAKACGIDSARAHVLGCARNSMTGLLKETKDLDAQKNFVLWGRSKFAARELVFIGAFYSCLGAAKDAMFR